MTQKDTYMKRKTKKDIENVHQEFTSNALLNYWIAKESNTCLKDPT